MSQTSKKVLLIVDDESDLREIIAEEVERAMPNAVMILEAGSGRDALVLVANNKVDLIVSDIMMPNGDGISLLDQVRMRDPVTPPVILMTGSHVDEGDVKMRGASAVLEKPLDLNQLLKSIVSRLNAA